MTCTYCGAPNGTLHATGCVDAPPSLYDRIQRRTGREQAVKCIAAMLDVGGPYEHGSGDERAALLASIRLIREIK